MSWFAALTGRDARAPARPLGPPFASEDDPYAHTPETRLLRRPVTWEVRDEVRSAAASGAGDAYLSLTRLRLVAPGAGGAAIPLHAVTDERYEQPIFGCNALRGTAAVDGRAVDWTLRFDRGGSAAFVTVFFRALALARSGVELESIDPAVARAHAAFAHAAVAGDAGDPSCVWADAEVAEEEEGGAAARGGDVPTATAVRVGLRPVNQGGRIQ